MIYVHWLILLIYGLAVVATMIRVLMDNRQPAKTMAWMLVLTFLPLLGIFLYFFFGQNTRKERLISQQSLDQLTKRSMLEFVEQKDLVIPITTRHSYSCLPAKTGRCPSRITIPTFSPTVTTCLASCCATSVRPVITFT